MRLQQSARLYWKVFKIGKIENNMRTQFKSIIAATSLAFVLMSCQTTANRTANQVGVPCQSLSYDFAFNPRGSENCRRFVAYEGDYRIPIERFLKDGDSGLLLTDMKFYSDRDYYESAKSTLKDARNFDFESQFKSNLSNNSGVDKNAIDFLRKLDLQFLKINYEKNMAIWKASSSFVGNQYNGFAFAKFISNGSDDHQLSGLYMKISIASMLEEQLYSVIDGIKFKKTEANGSPSMGSVEDRLSKLKVLEEKGLLSKDEAVAKRKAILEGL